MKVQYSYLEQQFQSPEKILNDIATVVKTGDFTLGKAVSEFEDRFAKLIGSEYAVGVNSGTDALFLSLKAIGVGPGDEVITAPNTFIATVGAIVAAGAKPVFADTGDDFTIDPERIEEEITSKTRAIMPVHYAGHPADMVKIMAIAENHGLTVIEDACQGISASIDGQCVGTFGVSGAFSLHPLKNLNVWGDGGMIITDSEEIREKLILLRNHGLKNRDEVQIFGYNSRLDSVQAVVGNHLIADMDTITAKRIQYAEKLDAGLADLKEMITIPKRKHGFRYVYHLYMIMAKHRDQLLAFLEEKGIEAKVHYPIPLHLQEAFRYLGYKKGDFPVTESQCQRILTLPVHQHLMDEQIEYIIDVIHQFYRGD